MKCPYCDAENAEDARFCENCGKPFPRITSADYVLCPNCSQKNSADMLFCEFCGQKLKDSPPDEVLLFPGQEEGGGHGTESYGEDDFTEEEYTKDDYTEEEYTEDDYTEDAFPGDRYYAGDGYRDTYGAGYGSEDGRRGGDYRRDPADSRKFFLIAGIVCAVVVVVGLGSFFGYRMLSGRDSKVADAPKTENGGEGNVKGTEQEPLTLNSADKETEGQKEETQTQAQTQSQTQAQTQSQTQSQTQAQTQSQTQAQTQPQTQAQTQPQTLPTPQGNSSFYRDGTVVQTTGYILPDSASRYLTDNDISKLTLKGICYAKNEIYARLGRKFGSAELAAYFGGQSWYSGIYEPNSENDEMLVSRMNEYENYNMQLLAQAEDAQGGYALDAG